MNSDRRLAVIAGVLFIVATVTNLLSIVFLGSVRGQDYLVDVSTSGHQVAVGALLLLIGAFASASIAIALYPVLRRYRGGLALGAVGFRLIEATLYIVGVISILSLLTLSQEFVRSGAHEVANYDNVGQLLQSVHDWAGLLGALAAYVGVTLYYWVFYETRIVPRWLTIWGMVGAGLGFVAALLIMFGAIGYMSTAQAVLNVPFAVSEIVLAIWLIAKGFKAAGGSTPQVHQATAGSPE